MLYRPLRLISRAVFWATMRIRTRRADLAAREDGYLLACSHVSHLDPFCLSLALSRKIHWMARIEFYRDPRIARLMHAVGTIPLNRQGTPVRAIKTAIERVRGGEVVGIFPEGEIKQGGDSVLRGGPLKKGVCLIAQRAGRPIVPCVIVGTEKLLKVGPWLPGRRGRLWIICGPAIEPVRGLPRKEAREQMARQLQGAFGSLYGEMRQHFALDDSIVP